MHKRQEKNGQKSAFFGRQFQALPSKFPILHSSFCGEYPAETS
jgi:hypothetical protein